MKNARNARPRCISPSSSTTRRLSCICARSVPNITMIYRLPSVLIIEPNFSIQKFLVGLLEAPPRLQRQRRGRARQRAPDGRRRSGEEENARHIPCSNCGMTYGQFRQAGLFGCSQCYQSFAEQLGPLLRRVQGNSRHTGKVPLRAGETWATDGRSSSCGMNCGKPSAPRPMSGRRCCGTGFMPWKGKSGSEKWEAIPSKGGEEICRFRKH